MPHFGQRSGSSLVTSGCIGQTKTPSAPSAPMSISATNASVLSAAASRNGAIRSRTATMSAFSAQLRERLGE